MNGLGWWVTCSVFCLFLYIPGKTWAVCTANLPSFLLYAHPHLVRVVTDFHWRGAVGLEEAVCGIRRYLVIKNLLKPLRVKIWVRLALLLACQQPGSQITFTASNQILSDIAIHTWRPILHAILFANPATDKITEWIRKALSIYHK